MYYTRLNTNLCDMILVGDEEGLSHLHLNHQMGKSTFEIPQGCLLKDDFFDEYRTQLLEYLDGKRSNFNLKLKPEGTEYQKGIWKLLAQIPYGETRTYKEIATLSGNPKASRAVGSANGKNPIPIIIPCHRVIGASGQLTGYAYGLPLKKHLLSLETKSNQ